MKTEVNSQKIAAVLNRGVEAVYPSAGLLERVLGGKKRLRVYCGFDPSSPHLHLGHIISLRKLAQFQALGHKVIMLIGDFTGAIGDPTGKIATRKSISCREALQNSRDYKKMAGKIINFKGTNPAQIMYNSKWLSAISFERLIKLSSYFTVQQIIARDMFQERIKKGKPIYLHEFLYPLAQAYDSVAMDVDAEVGGTDQTFNMLRGRDLIKALKDKEKFVISLKLLADSFGKKMGKTEANAVNIDDEPEEIYGKIMSWSDELIIVGMELCTDIPTDKIKEIAKKIKAQKINPREAKAMLAREVVSFCYNKKESDKAEQEFNKIFQKKDLPSRVPRIIVKKGSLSALDLLMKTGLVFSKAAAKRLFLQGGVKINGKVKNNPKELVSIRNGAVVQVGKRKFVKVNYCKS